MMESSYQKLEIENNNMLRIKDDLVNKLDRIFKKLDANETKSAKTEIVNMIQILMESQQQQRRQNELLYSEDRGNMSQDDINNSSSKRGNYITQNYEKFKQNQEKTKTPPENKIKENTKLIQNNQFDSKSNFNKNKSLTPVRNSNEVRRNEYPNYNIQYVSSSKGERETPKHLQSNSNPNPNNFVNRTNNLNIANTGNSNLLGQQITLQQHHLNTHSTPHSGQNSSKANPIVSSIINSKLKSDQFINKFINSGSGNK
jgi:hypothetical protein